MPMSPCGHPLSGEAVTDMAHFSCTVPEGLHGARAEALVRRYLPELSDAQVRAVFEHRDMKLDGQRVRRDARVQAGQKADIYYMEPAGTLLDIVYEDSSVLLVNKRAGMSVERDSGGGVCVQDLVQRHTGEKISPAACHRLDNQTCGLLLFAKTEEALSILTDVFRNRTLEKHYTCLVRGSMKPPEATCRAYLLKDPEAGRVRVLDQPEAGARTIVTAYRTLSAEGSLSRLDVHLITGRTHQIRAHLAALGHPILGDDLYGDRTFNRTMHAQGRLMLCSTSLCLDTGGRLPGLDHRLFTVPCPF